MTRGRFSVTKSCKDDKGTVLCHQATQGDGPFVYPGSTPEPFLLLLYYKNAPAAFFVVVLPGTQKDRPPVLPAPVLPPCVVLRHGKVCCSWS